MIQSFYQIFSQSNLINQELTGQVYIQKIFSSSNYICLSLRAIGKTEYLYIGRGAGHEGLWLHDIKVESFLRKRDKFLEYLRHHLSNSTFKNIEMDDKDRAFSVDYFKWGRINKLFFFYNARNLYFANYFFDQKSGEMKLFKSWEKKHETLNSEADFDIFDEVGRIQQDLEHKKDKDVVSISQLLKAEKKKANSLNSGGKSKKFYNRKKKRIEEDLNKVALWPELSKIAMNEQDFSTYPHRYSYKKIKIRFDYSDHYKRRDQVFEKVKKLKKAQKILTLRLADTAGNLKNISTISVENKLKTTAPVWYKEKKKESITIISEKKYRVYSFESMDCAVGETAIGNDQMRKEWAKKDDIWFHLDGDKSPHIIVKVKDGVISPDKIELISGLMIDRAQLTYQEVNLIYTQVKNLKGVKGVPGKVNYKKEKRIRSIVDTSWSDKLL